MNVFNVHLFGAFDSGSRYFLQYFAKILKCLFVGFVQLIGWRTPGIAELECPNHRFCQGDSLAAVVFSQTRSHCGLARTWHAKQFPPKRLTTSV